LKIRYCITVVCAFFAITLYSQTKLTDVSVADNLYKTGQYVQALFVYQNIETENGGNQYDKRIKEIEKMLKDETLANEQFQNCIISGNSAIKNNDYELAYICFKAALILKPEANFPKNKLADISPHIKDPSIEKEYQRIVKIADDYYGEQEYDLAIKMYKEALFIKTADAYCTGKITEIEAIQSKELENKKLYDDYIFNADRLMQNADYESAKAEYQKALDLFPREAYPKQKLAEINSVLSDISATKQAFADAVSNGDRAFNNEQYEQAKNFYTEALTIDPTAQYPTTMLATIQNIYKQQNAKEDEILVIRNKIYSAIEAKQYNIALSHVQTGLRMLPTDEEFISQRSLVDSIIMQRKLNDINYDNYMSNADEYYSQKEYEMAKYHYTKALELKYSHNLESKINNLDTLIFKANQEKIVAAKTKVEKEKTQDVTTTEKSDKPYKDAVKKGDANYKKGRYEVARDNYSLALKLQPGEEYPQSRIASIDSIFARQQKVEDSIALAKKEAEDKEREEYFEKLKTPAVVTAATYDEGVRYFNQKRYDLAYDKFDAILSKYPEHAASGAYYDSILTIFNNNTLRLLQAEPVIIQENRGKVFSFNKLNGDELENSYLAVVVKKFEGEPRLYINFCHDKNKMGGVVLKDIVENRAERAVYIYLSDKIYWRRDEINYLLLLAESGSCEVVRIEIISVK